MRVGVEMSALEFLKEWRWLPSREGKVVFATGSELRRWFERGSVEIDGVKVLATDPWPLPDQSVVVHPNGKHRTTLQ